MAAARAPPVAAGSLFWHIPVANAELSLIVGVAGNGAADRYVVLLLLLSSQSVDESVWRNCREIILRESRPAGLCHRHHLNARVPLAAGTNSSPQLLLLLKCQSILPDPCLDEPVVRHLVELR